jgi:acetyl esterase/lipase
MSHREIDFEAEYNNRARVPDHPAHIAAWHRDAAAYRASARCELDLPYGSGERNRIDFFYPEGGDLGGPVVLFIHGGYWQALDKSSASHLARGANLRGLTVAVPSYSLAPAVSLASIVSEIEAAADFVMGRTGRALVASGHSAGGHLSAWLMTRPEAAARRAIRAALPISGLFDLVPLVPTSINKALGLTMGEACRLSPIHSPAPVGSHLIAAVGGAESVEFRRQSRMVAERWAEAGVVTNLYEVPGAHHFDVINGLAEPDDPLVDALVRLSTVA